MKLNLSSASIKKLEYLQGEVLYQASKRDWVAVEKAQVELEVFEKVCDQEVKERWNKKFEGTSLGNLK